MKLGRVRLSVADARDLAEGALRGIGYENDEARIIADHVIDAAMCGYEYSGLAKILNVSESEHFRLPRRSMKVLRETEVSLALDGGNNVGMLALFHATQATIDKTKAHGIALVSVTDAWMSGRSAYYVEMIAKHRLIAIHAAASSPQVAPPGGIRPVLGTITPFGGSSIDAFLADGNEDVRLAVNDAITAQSQWPVADFAAALADPDDSGRLAAGFDEGDGVHPGDAGARALAAAVDLAVFR